MVSSAVYQEHMLRAQGAGNWFQFRRDYVTSKLLTKIQALFLQDLINHAGARDTKRKLIDGEAFFLCTTEYLRNSLSWEPDSQQALLSQLKTKGFIKVRRIGVPPLRWICIDVEAIETALDEAIQTRDESNAGKYRHLGKSKKNDGSQMPGNTGIQSQGNTGINKDRVKKDRKNSSWQATNGGAGVSSFEESSTKQVNTSNARIIGSFALDHIIANGNPQEEKCAAKLYKTVAARRRCQRHYDKPPIKKWAVWFVRLHQQYEWKYIHYVLDTYLEHFLEDRITWAFCGKTFYEEFDRIVENLRKKGYLEGPEDEPSVDKQRVIEQPNNKGGKTITITRR